MDNADRANPADDKARPALEAQARRERHAAHAGDDPLDRLTTEPGRDRGIAPAGFTTVLTFGVADEVRALERKRLHERVERDFTYHAPTPEKARQYERLRNGFRAMAHELVDTCPPGRELSLALTKLEEANMIANAGIARSED